MDAATLRWAAPADHDALGEVMFDAVRRGRSPYTEAQRAAWMPAPRGGPEWSARLSTQRVVLAEADGILGFMGLEPPDHLDLAYLRPAARGRGLFRRMFEMIEAEAARCGASQLRTEASLLAHGPMTAMGFETVREETVRLNGQPLRRFAMARPLALHPGPAPR